MAAARKILKAHFVKSVAIPRVGQREMVEAKDGPRPVVLLFGGSVLVIQTEGEPTVLVPATNIKSMVSE